MALKETLRQLKTLSVRYQDTKDTSKVSKHIRDSNYHEVWAFKTLEWLECLYVMVPMSRLSLIHI